MQKADTSMLT